MDSIKHLLSQFNQIADQNNWHAKHSPKNLVMAISVEAAELLATLQWVNESDSQQLNGQQKHAVGHEMADVFLYLLCLADKLDIDLLEAAREKMQINLSRNKQSN